MGKGVDSVLNVKSYTFAIRIVKLCQFLQKERFEYVISKQVLRSGTSIGASIRESEFGQSKSDFIHKLSIALKEANETDYWISLLYDTEYIDKSLYKSIQADCNELISLLAASIKTLKANLNS
ncbi:MAG: four helix bundle protein [Prevotella sp.]|jgi:four helix bundle protein|nr:four helix bundle protein [Prevotella sp.]